MSYGFRNLQLKMLSNGDACTVFAQYEALTSDDKYLQTESENFLKDYLGDDLEKQNAVHQALKSMADDIWPGGMLKIQDTLGCILALTILAVGQINKPVAC
ncbi:hypothetical protein QE152_g10567 [Popillia japonica]|uniref:Uncharacterized protein n=1 Tax=Popillia japonica TaxID=7064 RepID=A0AAW1LUX6_POPJA